MTGDPETAATREVIEKAAGDRRVPNASLNGPTPTPVTRERAEDFSRGLL
jgi:hypothetical protein